METQTQTGILKEGDWTSLEMIARSHGFKRRFDDHREAYAALLAASKSALSRINSVVDAAAPVGDEDPGFDYLTLRRASDLLEAAIAKAKPPK